jgi:hypothetical protein
MTLTCRVALLAIAVSAVVSPLRAQADSGGLVSLVVHEVRTPRFQVRHYATQGTYPRVADERLDLRAVNLALRATVIDDQRRYARLAGRRVKGIPLHQNGPYGLYQTGIGHWFIAASSAVVSGLLPDLELFPGGNDGAGWIPFTIRVPSGKPVTQLQLIAHGRRGVRAFTSAVLRYGKNQSGQNTCSGAAYRLVASRDPTFSALYPRDQLGDTVIALVPGGVIVGTPNYVIPPACGRIELVIPYRVIRPYLSPLARTLATGIRPPLHP